MEHHPDSNHWRVWKRRGGGDGGEEWEEHHLSFKGV